MKGRPLLVTAALVRKGDRLLIAQRLPDSRFEPNKWEFPGGKVDFGEHPRDSLERELQEELGVKIEAGTLYTLASHVYDQGGMVRHVVILFFKSDLVEGEPRPIDCQDIRWVSRKELSKQTYVEGDHPVMEMLAADDGFWT